MVDFLLVPASKPRHSPAAGVSCPRQRCRTVFETALAHRPNADLVVDVGLNVGAFSVMALHVCKTCSVLGFEAVPNYAGYARERLSRAFTADGPFTVITKGLGARTETVDIFVSQSSNLGWNTLLAEKATTDMVPMHCDLIAFDGYMQVARLAASRIRVIKIDTEGAEFKVLAGMRTTLAATCPRIPIVLEIGFGDEHPFLAKELAELAFLASIGYERLTSFPKSTKDVLLVQNASFVC